MKPPPPIPLCCIPRYISNRSNNAHYTYQSLQHKAWSQPLHQQHFPKARHQLLLTSFSLPGQELTPRLSNSMPISLHVLLSLDTAPKLSVPWAGAALTRLELECSNKSQKRPREACPIRLRSWSSVTVSSFRFISNLVWHTHKDLLCEVRQGGEPQERPHSYRCNTGTNFRITPVPIWFKFASRSNANLWSVSLGNYEVLFGEYID